MRKTAVIRKTILLSIYLFAFLQILSVPSGLIIENPCEDLDKHFSSCYQAFGMPAPIYSSVRNLDIHEFFIEGLVFNVIISIITVCLVNYFYYLSLKFFHKRKVLNIPSIILFVLFLMCIYYYSAYFLGVFLEHQGFYDELYKGGGFILEANPLWMWALIAIPYYYFGSTILWVITVFVVSIFLVLLLINIIYKRKFNILLIFLITLIIISNLSLNFLINFTVFDLNCRHASSSACDG